MYTNLLLAIYSLLVDSRFAGEGHHAGTTGSHPMMGDVEEAGAPSLHLARSIVCLKRQRGLHGRLTHDDRPLLTMDGTNEARIEDCFEYGPYRHLIS